MEIRSKQVAKIILNNLYTPRLSDKPDALTCI